MEQKKFDHNGISIHYTISGSGHAVMLLHGFGEDREIWKGMSESLVTNYQLIIPDIPGSGGTGVLQKGSLEDHAAWCNELLDKEKITQCILIGHSMGGYIALAFAEKYPEKLKAVGLFHSSAYADDEEKIKTRRKAIAFIKENGAVAFLKTSIPGLFKDEDESKMHVEWLIDKAGTFKPEALIQYYEAMIARPDRTTVLEKFEKPVLFILGEHDKAVPFDQGLKQSHIPSISYLKVLRESGHMGMLEEKERSEQILSEFLHQVKNL